MHRSQTLFHVIKRNKSNRAKSVSSRKLYYEISHAAYFAIMICEFLLEFSAKFSNSGSESRPKIFKFDLEVTHFRSDPFSK